MNCQLCAEPDCRVIDTRSADDGASVRRRRQCQRCGHRFTTMETCVLLVVKQSGVTEVFDRRKIVAGVRAACQGRPVEEGDLARIGHAVEESVRQMGRGEVASDVIGLAVLPHLKDLDHIAYMRFASVYKAFDSLDDFAKELDVLRGEAGEGEEL